MTIVICNRKLNLSCIALCLHQKWCSCHLFCLHNTQLLGTPFFFLCTVCHFFPLWTLFNGQMLTTMTWPQTDCRVKFFLFVLLALTHTQYDFHYHHDFHFIFSVCPAVCVCVLIRTVEITKKFFFWTNALWERQTEFIITFIHNVGWLVYQAGLIVTRILVLRYQIQIAS